jgi:glycosyltransferase involved in cell wall biosynthesis
MIKNIGFLSTRIAGTDGVSLEIEKWSKVLEANNFNCFYFAGEIDREKECSFFEELAHFNHPEIVEINSDLFGKRHRKFQTSKKVSAIKEHLKEKLYEFVKKFDIHLIIPENILAIPMNVPLGLAVTEFIMESSIPTIAHHHDFFWERDRFLVNAAKDYLDTAFPPVLNSIVHVTINSIASEQVSHRKGLSNVVIPNVYDYKNKPSDENRETSKLIRRLAGLAEDEPFILQPTRVVPRKWIERSIEIVYLLKLKNPKLIISHASGDEGDEYFNRIKEYAKLMNVELVFMDSYVKSNSEYGSKEFTIGDVYKACDLVTYPSGYEGFGNAFLETIYYRKPIIVNRYSIFITDIEPYGFDVFKFDGFVTNSLIDEIKSKISNKKELELMLDTNYRLAEKYFSFEVLEEKLLTIIKSLKNWR